MLLNNLFVLSFPHVDVAYRKIEEAIVERLLNGFGEESDKYIVNLSVLTGGFANQFRALLGNVVLALSTGRKLRSKLF